MENRKIVAMETVWNWGAKAFTGSFVVLMVVHAVHEFTRSAFSWQLNLIAIWIWWTAAAWVFLTGWFAIVWKPFPNTAWRTFVFVIANVVVIVSILLSLTSGLGSGAILG